MSSDNEIFPTEFRHEQVQKFVIGLLNGSITLLTVERMPEAAVEIRGKLLSDIEEYVSGTLRGQELSKVEQRIFSQIARMRVTGIIEEVKPSPSQIENEIAKLHTRIDATNTLLKQVLIVLQELMKKIDK